MANRNPTCESMVASINNYYELLFIKDSSKCFIYLLKHLYQSSWGYFIVPEHKEFT